MGNNTTCVFHLFSLLTYPLHMGNIDSSSMKLHQNEKSLVFQIIWKFDKIDVFPELYTLCDCPQIINKYAVPRNGTAGNWAIQFIYKLRRQYKKNNFAADS